MNIHKILSAMLIYSPLQPSNISKGCGGAVDKLFKDCGGEVDKILEMFEGCSGEYINIADKILWMFKGCSVEM